MNRNVFVELVGKRVVHDYRIDTSIIGLSMVAESVNDPGRMRSDCQLSIDTCLEV